MRQSPLFMPMTIGSMTVRNRIAIPPMCQYMAQDGKPTNWHKVHYGKLAGSGAGLICLEATGVAPQARVTAADLGLWRDDQQQALAELIALMREMDPDVKIMIQLYHGGRKSSVHPWDRHAITQEEGGWVTQAPSAIAYPGMPVPHEMSLEEIKQCIADFAAAAKRAQDAGLDAIQLHASHGYLIHQFMSPLTNHRQDAYGGSFENRIRLAVEILQAMRKAAPHVVIGARVTTCDWVPGSWSDEDTIAFCQALKDVGCEFIDVTTGGLMAEQQIPVSYGYHNRFARLVKTQIGLPTFLAGLIKTAQQAESLVADETTDFVHIGRQYLLDPHWAWRAALELKAEVQFPNPYKRGMVL